MNETFVLLQLGFNIVMFIALVALAWRTRSLATARGKRRDRSPAPSMPKAVPAPSMLDDLVAEADERELAAEAALRARLAQFKNRAIS